MNARTFFKMSNRFGLHFVFVLIGVQYQAPLRRDHAENILAVSMLNTSLMCYNIQYIVLLIILVVLLDQY